MDGRRWLRYLTIGIAVLILSGCRHASWTLHGDWSLGMRRDRGCRGACEHGIVSPMGPPLGSAASPPAETFAVAPHAKFHPVPTQPVFAPRPMLAAHAVEGLTPPARHRAPPERIEEELPPPKPDPLGWRPRLRR